VQSTDADAAVWWSPDNGCWIGSHTARHDVPLAATDPKDPTSAVRLLAATLDVPADSIRVLAADGDPCPK
jgi:hypothetical protein